MAYIYIYTCILQGGVRRTVAHSVVMAYTLPPLPMASLRAGSASTLLFSWLGLGLGGLGLGFRRLGLGLGFQGLGLALGLGLGLGLGSMG